MEETIKENIPIQRIVVKLDKLDLCYLGNLSNTSAVRCLADDTGRHVLAGILGVVGFAGLAVNCGVLAYIVKFRLFKNYVSTHFIAHLLLANILSLSYIFPIFIRNLWVGNDFFGESGFCRVHAFVLVTIWTVVYFMLTCIAGVHLLTFARIHYDQLFGLSPTIICGVSWVIGAALGLPCLTNSSIVHFDKLSFQCIWSDNQSSYKFLAYMILLGVLLPLLLTIYAYFRILAIFYHSPLVFEALGLFRSRYLVFGFIINSLAPIPYYAISPVPVSIRQTWTPFVHPICAFFAFSASISSSLLYGVSLVLMKEDDIALTSAAHKQAAYISPGAMSPEV